MAKLVTIDPYSATATEVGPLTTGKGTAAPHDLTFEGNRLLGWKGAQMAEVNVLSGQIQLAAASVGGGGCGVASVRAGTMLFTPQRANQSLFTVDTSTGIATAGPTMNGPSQTINALTYVGTTLFGSVASPTGVGQTVALYTIDPANGTTQLRGALPPNIDAIEGIPAQDAIPLPPPPASNATSAVAELPAAMTIDGRTIEVAALLDRGTEIQIDGNARRIVPLTALHGGKRIVLVDAAGRTRVVTRNSGLALSPNQRGELKLVDPRAGFRKLFGPVTEIR
jgi:hypothetical protein